MVEDRLQSLAAVEKVSSDKIIKPKVQTTKIRQNALLVFCVYASAIFVYVELIALIVALNKSYTPPGLIFLLSSLGYIGYIIFKVSF